MFFKESKIFKREEVLDPEYLPEVLPHRENQIKQLADNLLPASEGRKPINTFIFGPPGIGKTASIKFVFREFEKFSNLKTIYLNCWEVNTSLAVLSEMTLHLGFFVQRRGWAKDEVFSRLVEALRKSKGAIVCLDEVDQLIYKDHSVLYDLLRINQFVKTPLGLVFISNDPFVFSGVEPRIRSSLRLDEIEFKPYSFLEMKDILEERAREAFFSYEKGVVALVANHAIKKGGDVRVGLEILLKAGRIAERENASIVKVEHVKKVLPKVKEAKPEILKERISDQEKLLLKILKKRRRWLTIKEIYEKYKKEVSKPLSERMIRNYLEHLASINLIDTIKEGKLIKVRSIA